MQGVKAHPQKFWFVENENLGKICENFGKIPENPNKIPENPNKIPENLGKIPENLGKNGAQHCLTSKNGAQGLQKNKWRPFVWRSHHKNGQQKLHDNFLVEFGKIWAKILCAPKNLLAPTHMVTWSGITEVAISLHFTAVGLEDCCTTFPRPPLSSSLMLLATFVACKRSNRLLFDPFHT